MEGTTAVEVAVEGRRSPRGGHGRPPHLPCTSCSTTAAVPEDAEVTMEGAAAAPNRAMEGATAREAAGSTSRGRGGVHGLRRPGAPQATPPAREKREAARPPGWRWTTLSLGEALPPWTDAVAAVWMKHTTGDALFAECLGHSAKALLHSAKALPSATLGKEQTAKPHPAKGSLPSVVCRALGKGFAECQDGTRQRKLAVSR